MAKDYSANYQKKVNSLSGSEVPLVLLEITHDDLPEPIRVVGDREDIVSNGVTFQKMGFTFIPPDDPESGRPEARLRVDNIGRELVEWLEIADWSKQCRVRIMQVLRSAPNDIEFEVTMGLYDITITSSVVEGKLTFDNFMGLPGVTLTYSMATAPGLH